MNLQLPDSLHRACQIILKQIFKAIPLQPETGKLSLKDRVHYLKKKKKKLFDILFGCLVLVRSSQHRLFKYNKMSSSSSSAQVETLLNFLSEHRELARGHLRSSQGRRQAKRLWEEITDLLNGMGGAIKSVQQWQKVWTDKKHLAKKTVANVRRDATGTGGGPPNASLSNVELTVLEIMGEGFGERQTSAQVSAFPTQDFEEEVASYGLEEPMDFMSPPLPATSQAPLHMQNSALSLSQPGPSSSDTRPVSIQIVEEQPLVSLSQLTPSSPGTLPCTQNVEQLLQPTPSARPSATPIRPRDRNSLGSSRLGRREITFHERLLRLEENNTNILRNIQNELAGLRASTEKISESITSLVDVMKAHYSSHL